ncbi:uncharacterized protein RAG0_13976 [Rhynchosporium agropyri]|uniref:Uncharacterized protein n=1 Tax=Rhynchosporium agropyri TaxID=914238 RepID=A0A1E1LF15_9HELO|nr:uncharacterized protein RAG0_13976 [Rhynchosporium agropyri]
MSLDILLSTASAECAPLSSKSSTDVVLKKLQLWYYQYEVTFGLYMLEPIEKALLNTLVLSSLALLSYIVLSLTPTFIIEFLSRAVSSLFWVHVNDTGNHFVLQQVSNPWVNATKIGWEELEAHVM